MSQITHFCGVKLLAWKSGCVKFWTNIMSTNMYTFHKSDVHSLQCKCTLELYGLNPWHWCIGPPTLQMCYAEQLKSLKEKSGSLVGSGEPRIPGIWLLHAHCFCRMGGSAAASHWFQPWRWTKSSWVQLHCNKCIVHGKPWFVCTI